MAAKKFSLKTSSFEPGKYIPSKYTCDENDISPQLSWENVPEGTDTFTIIVDDPDALGRVFTHWVVYNIPNNIMEFEEGISAMEIMKKGASQGKNDFGIQGYGGPCPPPGKPHRYRFHIYALDTTLDLPSGVTKNAVLGLLKGHILAENEITGLYKRSL
jgi:hypothetical protein